MDWMKFKAKNLIFKNLDRQVICQELLSINLKQFFKPQQILTIEIAVKFEKPVLLHLNLGHICMALTLELETQFLEVLNTSQIYPITSKVCFVKGLANSIMTFVPNMIHICPNNLPLWQSVTKSQQTNDHMREVINHSTHTNLLNTIKFILTQTLEKLCKNKVHGKKTLTTYISETL